MRKLYVVAIVFASALPVFGKGMGGFGKHFGIATARVGKRIFGR